MDGSRLGSMDLDFGVNVAAFARPSIIELMKTRMETVETHLVVLLLFVVVVIVIVVILVVLNGLVIAAIVVAAIIAIAIATHVINVPSMVVSLTR